MALVLNFPTPIGHSQPDADLVEMLEDFLDRAKSGELQSLCIVTAERDGTPSVGLKMERGAAAAMIGAMRVAESKLIKIIEADL